MLFLTPRYVKQGRAFLKDARKLLAYKRDLWEPKSRDEFEAAMRRLDAAIRERNKQRVEEIAGELDRLAGAVVKPLSNAGWRENCEVFLVAIVVALGVRTYFLQPFTIPTGSMQPTLSGIVGHPTSEPPPNLLVRVWQKCWNGRTWINVVAQTNDVILDMQEVKKFGFFTRTLLIGARGSYTVNAPIATLRDHLLPPVREFTAGEVIARGYYDTGDHVFVDKLTYHFRKPRRDEVFVFSTQNVATPENRRAGMRGGPSQFYIKRLVGLPNDLLQIVPPELRINGERAQGAGMERVMSEKDGYRGYSGESEHQGRRYKMNFLSSPDETLRVPEGFYFAMGDNSFHSSDSRDWGPVPERNIMGRGIFVYWPFGRNWGFFR